MDELTLSSAKRVSETAAERLRKYLELGELSSLSIAETLEEMKPRP